MTVTSELAEEFYTATGSTSLSAHQFRFRGAFLEASNMNVIIKTPSASDTEVHLTYLTDFVLTSPSEGVIIESDFEEGASVDILSTSSFFPFAANTLVYLYTDLPITQEVDYPENTAFPAKTTEQVLDRLTLICQQLKRNLSKALSLPISSMITGATLPVPQPGKAIIGNTTGTSFVNSESLFDDILPGTQLAATNAQLAASQAAVNAASALAEATAAQLSADAAAASAASAGLSFGVAQDAITGSSTTLAVNCAMLAVPFRKGSDISSAGTITLPNSSSNVGGYHEITGTTNISHIFQTGAYLGREVTLRFNGILTLVNNSTQFPLLTNASIVVAVGDIARFRCIDEVNNYWRMFSYERFNGKPLKIGQYDSGQQTLTAGTYAYPHSLGGKPDLNKLFLFCSTTSDTYTAGDEIEYLGSDGSAGGGMIVMSSDTTNVNIVSPTSVIQIGDKTGSTNVSITRANWRLIIRSYKFT